VLGAAGLVHPQRVVQQQPDRRDAEHLGHDRGHRILRLERKGDVEDRTVLTAPVARAIGAYLAGRDSGPIFVTKAGRRMDQPEAWRMIRRIARRAELDGAGEIRPHTLDGAEVPALSVAGQSLPMTSVFRAVSVISRLRLWTIT
jgi:hypothetical protein